MTTCLGEIESSGWGPFGGAAAGQHSRGAQTALQNASAPGDQVDDQDHQCDYQQNVNQATGDVKAEAQNPQNQKDNENCPKHIQHTSLECGRLSREVPPQARAAHSQTAVSSMQSLALLLA